MLSWRILSVPIHSFNWPSRKVSDTDDCGWDMLLKLGQMSCSELFDMRDDSIIGSYEMYTCDFSYIASF